MVLKENMKVQVDQEKKDKFKLTWLGPYVVTTSFGSGAYQLSTLEGDVLNDPTNIIHLKKFYAWKQKFQSKIGKEKPSIQ